VRISPGHGVDFRRSRGADPWPPTAVLGALVRVPRGAHGMPAPV